MFKLKVRILKQTKKTASSECSAKIMLFITLNILLKINILINFSTLKVAVSKSAIKY